MAQDWDNHSYDEFPAEVKAKFDHARKLYKAWKAAQREAETEACAFVGCGSDETLVWNYRFGTPSFKLVAKDEKPAKAQAKPKLSLSEYLAQRRAAGLSA